MEIKDFVKKFEREFDEVEKGSLTAETKFHDLDEWSSLLGLSIIAMVDDEYDVQLKGDDIRNASTIGELFQIIESKKE
jgi:acyl carrier protein